MARLTAWLMLAAVVVCTVAVAIANGVVVGTSVLPLGVPLVAVAGAVLRLGVVAEPGQLVVSSGWKRREIRWESVEGFRIEDDFGKRRIVALVRPNTVVALPVANGGFPITSRTEVHSICDALERYRVQHSSRDRCRDTMRW